MEMKKVKKGKDQIVFGIIGYLLVTVFALACIIPFYLIVVGSFTAESKDSGVIFSSVRTLEKPCALNELAFKI